MLQYRNDGRQFGGFQDVYRRNAAEAAGMLDRMLADIRTSDPEAIVFVFGDHGAWISRGMAYGEKPEFVVQDRHGILGAVFGAEACMPFLQPAGGARFQTSSRVVAGILQCLAGGESPLTKDYDFGRIYQAPTTMRFEDYAYE
jgi:hypothetical protein